MINVKHVDHMKHTPCHPKNYTKRLWFVGFCWGLVSVILLISFKGSSLALGQLYHYPRTRKAKIKDYDATNPLNPQTMITKAARNNGNLWSDLTLIQNIFILLPWLTYGCTHDHEDKTAEKKIQFWFAVNGICWYPRVLNLRKHTVHSEDWTSRYLTVKFVVNCLKILGFDMNRCVNSFWMSKYYNKIFICIFPAVEWIWDIISLPSQQCGWRFRTCILWSTSSQNKVKIFNRNSREIYMDNHQ